MRRLFAVKIIFIIVGCTFFAHEPAAQKSKTGDFDINKVHEAIKSDIRDSVTPGIYPDNQSSSLSGNYFFLSMRIIGYLILLSLIIAVAIWFIKRMGLSGTSRIGGGSMDLLEALPIGQNRSLILVRVMNTVYVLAQTSQNITLLETIEGEKAVELIASTKGGTSILQFKDVFNNFIGKIKKSS